MTELSNPTCPHCGGQMLRWANPESSTWSGSHQFVCFDDECPYFVGGWDWMMSRYNVAASYRYRLDPATGERGPLPVWSASALRNNVIDETEGSHAV
jgi:hypothetical protein